MTAAESLNLHNLTITPDMSTAFLLQVYTQASGRNVKKFASRAAALKQTVAAIARWRSANPLTVPTRIVEDPETKLLRAAPGVDPATLTIEERAQIAQRMNEVGPKLRKYVDKEAAARFAAEAARRNAQPQYVIAASGLGYLLPGETSWGDDPAAALHYLKREAGECSLGTLFHRNAAPEHARVIRVGDELPVPPTPEQRKAARAEVDRLRAIAKAVKPAPKAGRTERQFGATKKAPKVKAPKAAAIPNGTTLAAICVELKINPRLARAHLRASGARAPEGGWAWAPEQVPAIKAELAKLK